MKKGLIAIFLIGVTFILVTYYNNMLKDKNNVKVISVFQTGVFSNYDEAMLASDSKSKIFYDGKFYHVYDAIVSSSDSKTKMIDFYKNNNIEYYIKEKYVSKELFDNIDKYSELIKISDDDTLKIINKQVIEKFGADVI